MIPTLVPMAIVSAFLRRSLCRWLGFSGCGVEPQATSPLLSLPLDVLFLILECLPSESSAALSLTCKLAFGTFFSAAHGRLDPLGRQKLLLLLEPSVSCKLYFCHSCTQLHRFWSFWGPSHRSRSYQGPRCQSDVIHFGDLQIGFHLVRLVKNAHLFGRGNGLNLRRLEIHNVFYVYGWENSSMARIINGQLYLRVSHRISLLEDRGRNRRGIRSSFDHHICRHITTHAAGRDPRDLAAIVPTQIPELERFGSMLAPDNVGVEECDTASGSCTFCLTDFTTTIKLRKKDASHPEREPLDVAIVSYHQLGRCPSPLDWKWQSLSAVYSRYPSEMVTRAQRMGPDFENGAIKRRWDEAD